MQNEIRTLNNNLKTLFIDSPGSTAASVQIWFRAGSALEENSNEGIAHFLEHMFFKGTEKRPGSAIAHEVESFGGEINAFTSFDYTCYYINTPNSYLKNTTEILMDMVSNPQFKMDDLLPERQVVFEEYRRSIDNPGQYSFHKLQKSSFTGGYAHPILGREDTILNFTQDQLKDFRSNFYNLSNALLVVSGDLNQKEDIIKTIESFKMPEGPESKFPKFKLKNKSTNEVHHKDVRMGQLTLCIQAPEFRQKIAVEEDLAINCLGHGESSRLYQGLVAKDSLANSCAGSTMFMNDGGVHFIRVVFPPNHLKKVLNRVYQVINNAVDEGFSDQELSKIKNQYIASKVYDMESLEAFSFSLGHSFAQTGDINGEEEFIDNIKKSTKAKVNNAIKSVFGKSTHVSLQLPKEVKLEPAKKDIEAFQKKLATLQKKVTSPAKSKYKVQTSKFDPQVKCYTLKKGIKLLYRQNTMNPTFVAHAYIKGGITEENKNNNGIYQIMSSVLSKGHSKIPYKKFKATLEDRSASLSGFSGKNAYGLTMHGQSEHFDELMFHFCGTLLKPDFPNERVKHEKEITLRNLENQQEDPIKQCFKKVSQMHFNGHPYAMNIQGTPTTIKKLTKKAITEKHQSSLKNKEILFTYCGDKELEEVIEKLQPVLDQLKPRAEKKLVKKKLKPITNGYEYIEFDREQTQIFYGIPSQPLGSKENVYLKMLTTMLSGQSSELFVEVRDRQGLCYAAQPIHFSAMEAGYWGIYMASGHDKVEAAISAIKGIINKIKENGLERSEFNRIKKMIEGQALLNIQTNDDYANIYSVTTLQGHGLDFYHLNNKRIKELDYEEFQKGIKKILSKKFNTVIVGRKN